jgi:RNA polymerase primary sigma factor
MDAGHNERTTLLSRYFSDIRRFPLLSRQQELVLARSVRRGDALAMQRLIESNLGFVVKVVSEYRQYGMSFEDLLNEGNLGLIEAARRFDHSKGTKFITYAVWWIRKSILTALSEHALVRVPTYQMRKLRELTDVQRQLRRDLGREPSREEIGRLLDQSIGRVERTLQLTLRETSLDQSATREGEATVGEFLVEEDVPTPEDRVLSRESTALIREALSGLTPQEQTVIRHRFGLMGDRMLTLKEIGERLGVSRERVRQNEVQAKGRLRRAFAKPQPQLAPAKGVSPNRVMGQGRVASSL